MEPDYLRVATHWFDREDTEAAQAAALIVIGQELRKLNKNMAPKVMTVELTDQIHDHVHTGGDDD